MRSLDECRAEIFARSEKRIARRRNLRRRVMAGVIPLCLCIVLFAMQPIRSGSDKSAPMENEGCAFGAAQQQTAVIRTDGAQWNLSEHQTEQLTRLLNQCLTHGVQAEAPGESDYELEIPEEDGGMIRCFLSGDQLTRDGLTVHLTDSELHQILEMIQPQNE